jgi:Na+/H+ antiporter NhaD/arsenite permease-like protein
LNNKDKWLKYLGEEWIVLIAAAGLIISSIILGKIPEYSSSEMEVLFILFVLFISIKGLENSGLISGFSRRIERGRFIALKMVLVTFFLSMLITNDVALIIAVPLTLLLNIDRKDYLVILEAIAANAGSALTPIGNPQNLFIYWYYNTPVSEFISTIAPFSVIFLILLIPAALQVKATMNNRETTGKINFDNKAYIYGILLVVVILAVLKLLPVATGIIAIIYAIIADRKSLKIDYALLISFLCFFGFADNMKVFLSRIPGYADHIFLGSALGSQILSNVPVTILFAKSTLHWKSLLWGASVGGFGDPVGSLANLIAFKIYLSKNSSNGSREFIIEFLIIDYAAFTIGILLYFIILKVL